ncbi:hypothetical protein [Caldisalinibacter kiritimatiensis]|uniref:Uncharacterized protein n=1 Tax=Caldisalinibacter kiritimatiensis TaxID=1304284 RepID=R1AR97_9FIRM|nr:hypothetical protein [Caldisalinibacter kiritimatiensis]EOC99682.1 hypothetical protein L21TH_2325 [Caldisalinibacter kiritimatiensis]
MESKKIRKFKKIIILLIVLLIISSYFNYQYYRYKQKESYKYEIFLNHFYFSVNYSINILDEILNEQLISEQLNKKIMRLVYFLNEADHLLSESAFYIEGVNSRGTTFFKLVSNVISYGTEYEGNKITAFLNDYKINQSERAYLSELKKYLEDIHSKLYSDETGQENPNISKYVFNHEIIPSANEDYILLNQYINSK